MIEIPQCSECKFSRPFGQCANSVTYKKQYEERRFYVNVCGLEGRLFQPHNGVQVFSEYSFLQRLKLALAFVLKKADLPTSEIKPQKQMPDYLS
jgi:hypothetical protein